MKPTKQHRTGFTMVELLVVLTVVGILCAILVGVFTRSRQKANQASCLSNLKQIYIGLQQYVQEHDSLYPLPTYWPEAAASFVKDQNVLQCPTIRHSQLEDKRYTYLCERVSIVSSGRLNGANESLVIQTAQTPVFSDNIYGPLQDNYLAQEVAAPPSCSLTQTGRPVSAFMGSIAHFGGGNYLFCDGHVKWLTPTGYAAAECTAGPYMLY